MQTFGDHWLVIGLMMIAAFAMGMTLLTLNLIVAPSRPNPTKRAPYESGVPQLDVSRKRVNVRFYQIAMLFILFDIEAAFLYPWAVIYRDATVTPTGLAWFLFLEMLIFIVLLAVGATAALAAITETRSSRTHGVAGNSKKTLKAAGKAAAAAVGRRIQNEFEEITAASKRSDEDRETKAGAGASAWRGRMRVRPQANNRADQPVRYARFPRTSIRPVRASQRPRRL